MVLINLIRCKFVGSLSWVALALLLLSASQAAALPLSVCNYDGVCDDEEINCKDCDGAPPPSVCGNLRVEGREQCDGGDCCNVDCTFKAVNTICRAASATCDSAEVCTGSSATCPADAVVKSGTICRKPAGVCDIAETCDGSGTECPPDSRVQAGTVCRASADGCDAAESCDGKQAACPSDVAAAPGDPCAAILPNRCYVGVCTFMRSCIAQPIPNCCGNGQLEFGEQCDDGNQADGDACSSTCLARAQCGNGVIEEREECDDGNVIDKDGCSSRCERENLAELDNFTCYRPLVLQLQEASGTKESSGARVMQLCAPTDKDGANPDALQHEAHLAAYRIAAHERSHDAGTLQSPVRVSNVLGEQSLSLGLATRLLVPTTATIGTLPDAPARELDSLTCYRARRAHGEPRLRRIPVELADQFGDSSSVILKPTAVCLPTQSREEGTAQGLVCYAIQRSAARLPRTFINNQFGPGTLIPRQRVELCVPSAIPVSGESPGC